MKLALLLLLSLPSFAADEFENIEKNIQALYGPVAKAAGGEFVIEKKMESNLELASADFTPGTYKVILHGGLLRSPKMTADLFRFTLCHELGHLFGGAPFRPIPPEWDGPSQGGDTFMSAEGQADYYAPLECFRRIAGVAPKPKAPKSLVSRCDRAWGKGADSHLCQRAALAGYQLLRLVKEFPISFDTPDTSKAPKTIRGEYPSRQCRLDTILAAATCTSRHSLDMRNELPRCQTGPSSRPACWFRH